MQQSDAGLGTSLPAASPAQLRRAGLAQLQQPAPALAAATHSGMHAGAARPAAWAGMQRLPAPGCGEHTPRGGRAAWHGGSRQQKCSAEAGKLWCDRMLSCAAVASRRRPGTCGALLAPSTWQAGVQTGAGVQAGGAVALTRTKARMARDDSSRSENRMSPCKHVGRRRAAVDAGKAAQQCGLINCVKL